ncbi:MAG TPA: hypothetical protein ENH84_04425 [Phycisphaerae bacterium]|nr:hypothetical protein [Phycisphaerae bacterium]
MEKWKIILLVCAVVFSSIVVKATAGQDQPEPVVVSQPFLEDMQRESAKKLKRFGEVLAAYAADHDGKFLSSIDRDNLGKLAPYVTPKDYKGMPLGSFVHFNVKYVAPSPHFSPVG